MGKDMESTTDLAADQAALEEKLYAAAASFDRNSKCRSIPLGPSLFITGPPLSVLGIEGARIIDASGNDIGPLEGFACLVGQTAYESMMASIPEGCTVVINPQKK